MDSRLGFQHALTSGDSSAEASRDAHLQAALDDALRASALQERGYAYILDLDRRAFAEYRADAHIYPASVIKLAILAEAFRRFSTGELRPDDRVTISPANQTTTACETPFASGYDAAIGEMVEMMITRSDNVATNQLIDVLRRERVTAYMRELGLATFVLGRKLSGSEPLVDDPDMIARNRFSPLEAARLLALIADDRVAGAAQQREIMGRCVHNEKLAAALPAGDRFMHKTGETSDTSHDAGILLTGEGRRYVVVLYTVVTEAGDAAAARADEAMREWMRRLRQAL